MGTVSRFPSSGQSIRQVEHTPYYETKKGGGDDGGNELEARVAKLESDVEYIKRDVADIKTDVREMKKDMTKEFTKVRSEMKTDFRIILGFLTGLAGLMAKGFGWL